MLWAWEVAVELGQAGVAFEMRLRPGKWPANVNRMGWPWKLERARKAVF